MASGRSQQRRPFRIQNYPDIVGVCPQGTRARVLVQPAGRMDMAVGQQSSGQGQDRGQDRGQGQSSDSQRMTAAASAAAGPVTSSSSGHPPRASTAQKHARKAQTLPAGSRRAGDSVTTAASTSAGSSSRPVGTRQWASSDHMDDASNRQHHQQQQQRMREAATNTTSRHQRHPVNTNTSGNTSTSHQPSSATASIPATSSSSSPPAAAAATAAAAAPTRVATVRDQSTQSSAEMASISLDVRDDPNSRHEELTTSATDNRDPQPRLPPYESRAATLDWDEIHEPSEALPDLLNSHRLPPNYVPAPRQNQHRSNRHGAGHASRQRARRSRNQQRPAAMTDLGGEDKDCCSRDCCIDCLTALTTFRWVLIALAMLGVCCVISGIVLGALHMTVGSSYLTLSLMFIGLGVLLVVVVGVGWRCTPPGHEPCHLLFGLGEHASHDSQRSRMSRPHRDRNQWYGGALYPEFRYRRPPPSYNTAMQEHQQQLALAQMQLNNEAAAGAAAGGAAGDNYSLPGSPPPTYRSRASTVRPGIHITFPPPRGGINYPSSGPPTYRSRADPSETSRPSLILDNEQSDSSGGVDNLGCVIQENSDSNPGPGPALPVGVENDSSTMARVNRVVEYLDGILEQQEQGMRAGPAAGSSQSSNVSADNSQASSSGALTPASVPDDGDEARDEDAADLKARRMADTPL